jgi:CubicO group peptidase (beta-lactamase class C family)
MRSSVPLARFFGAVLVVLLAGPARADHSAAKLDRKAIDAHLADAVKLWQVPGLACAVVRGDEVYLGAAGVRRAGGKERLTADTIFSIGSCTKAFTATALGILVDEKKADWDDRVRKHLLWFRLSDPLADREVRLRDLLCHRTGLGRHDPLWYRASWSVEESVRRMAYLERASSFRSTYEYNNLAYLAAGLAIAAAAKEPWHEFTRKRLLEPLGMKSAVFTSGAAQKTQDHATPHRQVNRNWTPIAWYPDDEQIRASGSIKASARDLSRWVRMQLGGGELEGKRIISREALAETHTPRIVMPRSVADAKLAESTMNSYGLGWRVTDYRGEKMLDHGGATDGFRARIILLPKAGVGIVLLANAEAMPLLSALGQVLMDRLLAKKPIDWHALYRKQARRGELARQARLKKLLASRKPNAKPSRELAAYAGTYRDKAYGEAMVRQSGKGLVLKWSSFDVPLQHWGYNSFVAGDPKGTDRMDGEKVVFVLDADAKVATLKMLGRQFARGE